VVRKYERYDGDFQIPADMFVTVKECGNITEIKYVSRRNTEPYILRVDKDHYIRLKDETGELLEIQHNNNRSEDTQSVKRSLERLRDYINTNVKDVEYCRWVTFTYADNMRDSKRLVKDYQEFNRLCRKRYGHYEYITAAEPQGRGAWHLHAVLIFDTPAPFMENSTVRKMWGQGFVNIRRLNKIDNLGLYLTAYLADMEVKDVEKVIDEIDETKLRNICKVEVIDENGRKRKKAIVKGARLSLYPSGFHLYRISRGIKKSVVNLMTNEQAETLVTGYAKIYENTVRISDEIRNFKIVTNKRVFNRNPQAMTFLKGGNDDESKTNCNNADY